MNHIINNGDLQAFSSFLAQPLVFLQKDKKKQHRHTAENLSQKDVFTKKAQKPYW
jgi:hypothetical protein